MAYCSSGLDVSKLGEWFESLNWNFGKLIYSFRNFGRLRHFWSLLTRILLMNLMIKFDVNMQAITLIREMIIKRMNKLNNKKKKQEEQKGNKQDDQEQVNCDDDEAEYKDE
ncbi:hypothetical protein RclHR1_09040001 [Rhizophagus clarus]|uniref:Uncharacterized protein n=1 Tax=Rhizophagus clarus TaxID=94130 RepID=A0A2Z6SHI8_9GLOM|nr:hypothetical protein RclHR1_09040001 [Rhizophagus clarus]